jgi:hypothetical protein
MRVLSVIAVHLANKLPTSVPLYNDAIAVELLIRVLIFKALPLIFFVVKFKSAKLIESTIARMTMQLSYSI